MSFFRTPIASSVCPFASSHSRRLAPTYNPHAESIEPGLVSCRSVATTTEGTSRNNSDIRMKGQFVSVILEDWSCRKERKLQTFVCLSEMGSG